MLTPFVLPHDDGAPGPTDLSFLNETSAGSQGWIHVGQDGHLQQDRQRVRFWGVNVTLDSTIPEPAMAEAAAARLAKFGFNCVRFVDMDSGMGRGLLIDYGKGHSQELNRLLLDRWHFFVAELKSRGIYTDICLLGSRRFLEGDGIPRSIAQAGEINQRIGAFFHPRLKVLQQDYARRLLTTVNPHTGLAPIADPAVAIVEVTQDRGLVFEWISRRMNYLTPPLSDELQARWNQWLIDKYQTTQNLDVGWQSVRQSMGTNLLTNGDFSQDLTPWVLEVHQPAHATWAIVPDPAFRQALRIETLQTSAINWHVQLLQPNLVLRKGQVYTLRLHVRCQAKVTLFIGISMHHPPWENLANPRQITLTPDWQELEFSILATRTDNEARLIFSGMAMPYAFEFADISLQEGGAVGRREEFNLENRAIPFVRRESGVENDTPTMLKDWVAFLHHLEGEYWRDMRQFLKEDLRYPGLVTGTFAEAVPISHLAQFDATSSHAYWQMPSFPSVPVQPDNWVIANASLVNTPPGPMADLACRRLVGKPHFIHEYGHAFPNSYESEGPLLVAAYGSFQDIDGVWLHEYTLHARELGYVAGFYSIDQHPTLMANALIGAALFRMNLIAPHRHLCVKPVSPQLIHAILATSSLAYWDMVDTRALGLSPELPLRHGVGLEMVDRDDLPLPFVLMDLNTSSVNIGYTPGYRLITTSYISSSNLYASDTGEIRWDYLTPERGVVVVDAPRVCGVIGFAGGKTFLLQGMKVTPAATQLNGWCTLMMAQIEGADWGKAGRILLLATGHMENTDMKWKSAAHESVGREWGHAPTLIEVVSASIQLPMPASHVMVWTLDPWGQRLHQLPVEETNEGCLFRIGGSAATLWYEIVVR